MNKADEVLAVKNLGESIGYGHMMYLASALWRKSLRDKNFPEYGAFVPALPTLDYDKAEESTKQMYDDLVKRYTP